MVSYDKNGTRVSKIHNSGETAAQSRTSRRMGTKSIAMLRARRRATK